MMEYRPKNGLDIWLNEKGFYRKHVAMDETCLFRAVSDQVHNTQIYHEEIRTQCIDFAKQNRNLFKDLLNDSEWDEHLYNLQKHFIVCGDVEIQVLSKMLERDFMIIDSNDYKTENVTNNGYDKIISLCKMKDGHYDSVWVKEHIENSGFCQSLIYKLVYEDIFGFDDIDEIVKTMLYPDDSEPKDNLNLFDMFLPSETEHHVEDDITKNPPFPYKVAKALDPNQYRNVEFDAWNQTRKDIRLKDWYMGGDDFKVGTKCLLIVENNSFDCYIQDINYERRENVCLVYVVEWAAKVVVQREELMALPDAKPWPLPYTMSRNIKDEPSVEVEVVESAVEVSETRTVNYNNKRRGNRRRRGQNNNRNNNHGRNDNNNNKHEVSPLEGCPLLALPFSPFVDENANNPSKEDINNNQNSLVPYEDNSLVPYEGNSSVPYEDNSLVPYESNNFVPYEENNAVPFEASYHSNNQSENNMASNNDWNRYDSWLSSPSPQLGPYPVPCPQVCVAAQCNTIIQENEDSKVTTVYSKFIKKTYKDNSQTANYPPTAYAMQPVPVYNYSEYQPQYCNGSCCAAQYQQQTYASYPEYQPQTVSVYSELYQPTQMLPVSNCPYDPQHLLGVAYSDYGGTVAPPPTPETPSTPVSPVMPIPFYPQPVPIGSVVYPCHYVPCYGYWIPNQMAIPQQNLPQTMYPQFNVPLPQDMSSTEDFDLKLEGEPVESPPYFKPENPEWPPETVFQYGTVSS